MRKISNVITAIFGLLFFSNWIHSLKIQSNYGSPGTSIPYVLGMLFFWSIIPGIFWMITYFVEKKKP